MTTFPDQHNNPIGMTPGRGSTPTGTVTLLFSDIEGSTRLLHRLGDRYAEMLEAQRRLLRTVFREHGGQEIDTAGDGFFIGFHRSRDAVTAAVAAQKALAAYAWPDGVMVRVRMGLHTGEPLLSDGSYVGLDVHRAARICSAGHGGQVLLSQATRELVEQDLPPGVELCDLGTHRLKDILQAEHLFQLIIPGLPSEFPPLRTQANRLDNLPVQPTGFIGRQQEEERVCQLLRRPTVRLVTLTGPGGIGKTRLSIQVASSLREDFPDGVCFVPLSSITDPDLVAATMAKTMGLAEHPLHPVFDRIKHYLRSRAMLLVLDNFEQVVDAVSVVAELMAACTQVKVLVTSRVVLHLSGEYEFRVPPLPLPDIGQLPSSEALSSHGAEALLTYPAVALFVERARATRSGFALTAENAAPVVRICRQVDGLPLAIELAAARIKLFSPQALLARLGRRLDLLKGGARDAPLRHQALRQTIAWSYELLGAGEQAFFRRMAVFMGGCTLEAADQVCVACGNLGPPCIGCVDEVPDALDAIAVLVDQSLLRQEEEPEDDPRFIMLETIREYGMERLRAAGEATAIGRAHAAYFLALVEQAEPELTGPSQAAWMDRLEVEHDNLRAALAWTEAHDGGMGLRLGAALWRFWIARGHMREGQAWLERLLSLPGTQERNRARMRALNGAGTLSHEISDARTARAFLEESLSIGRELGEKREIATVLNNLGWLALFSNDFDAIRVLSEEGRTLCRVLGDKRGEAVALNNLALVARIQSEYANAISLIEKNLALRREIGDHRGAAFALTYLGWVETLQGHYEQAKTHIEEAIAVLRDLGDKQGTANALGFLGNVLSDLGHYERAWIMLEESVSQWRDVGNRTGLGEGLNFLGKALLGLGHLEQARNALEEAKAIYQDINMEWGMSDVLYSLGCVMGEGGHDEEALALYRESLVLRRKILNRLGIAECLEGVAKVFVAQEHFERATRLFGRSAAMRKAVGAPLPPRSQVSYANNLSRLRSGLGEEAFARAWSTGRAMSLDEAMALTFENG